MQKITKALILALAVGMLGGCADGRFMSRINAQLDEAKAAAAAAKAKADDAYKLAQSASETASEAAYNANQAQTAADSALECCNKNSSKIERMFKKAMRK